MTHPTAAHVKNSYSRSITWRKNRRVVLGERSNGQIVNMSHKTWIFIECSIWWPGKHNFSSSHVCTNHAKIKQSIWTRNGVRSVIQETKRIARDFTRQSAENPLPWREIALAILHSPTPKLKESDTPWSILTNMKPSPLNTDYRLLGAFI